MANGGAGKPSSAVSTANRKTVVTLNEYKPVVTQPQVKFERSAEEIGQVKSDLNTAVTYYKDIGWRVRSYQSDYGKYFELTDGQSGTVTISGPGAGATAATFLVESYYQRQSGLSGVSYNGSPSSGFPGIKKEVSAGTAWNATGSSLAADETAFPGPDQSAEVTDLDRVYHWTTPHDPKDDAHFWFTTHYHSVGGWAAFAQFYFSGPPGGDSNLSGYGQYCLRLYGDGTAFLYERGGGDVWVKRDTFTFDRNRQLSNKTYILSVHSDCFDDIHGNLQGSKMTFVFNGIDNGESITSAMVNTAIGVIRGRQGNFDTTYTYHVPSRAATTPAQLQPVRIDLRRDIRCVFHTSKSRYPTSGVIQDAGFSLDFEPNTSKDFQVDWDAILPDGTSIDVKMYDADTDAELTQVGPTVFQDYGGYKFYTPNNKQRHYYCKIFFTATTSSTPTFLKWKVFRDPGTETPTVTTVTIDDARSGQLPLTVVSRVTVQQGTADPSAAGATITINDFTDRVTDLRIRDSIPISVYTQYDTDTSLKSYLFRGYTREVTSTKKSTGNKQLNGSTKNWPSADWREYTVSCVGEYARLFDTLSPKRYTWFEPQIGITTFPVPFKVTDMVKTLLEGAGIFDYDVPDLPIRLFTTEQDQYILEPEQRIAPVICKLLGDYLGAYLVFDENAGTLGKWRVLQQKTPPYHNLARFVYGSPSDFGVTGKVLPHVDSAFGVTTVDGQTIPHAFIRKGTDVLKTIRPEANCVAVYGAATGASAAKDGQNSASLITRVLYNVNSYNFLGLASGDPGYPTPTNNPDYIGWYVPLKLHDPTLSSQDAVDWVARRLFQYACFGRTELSFTAPLVLVTDITDTEQTNPRPLRYYDAVQVWNGGTYTDDASWDQFIVTSVTPMYTKDGFQFAQYKLATTTAIDTAFGGTGWAAFDYKSIYGDFAGMILSLNNGRKTGLAGTIDKRMAPHMADWMALPESTADPIQDLDNTSGTFGQFLPTMDFDALG